MIKSVLLSKALAFTDVIPMSFKKIFVRSEPLHVISVLFSLSTPSHVQGLLLLHASGCAPTQQVNATTVRKKTRNFIVLIV